MTQIFGRERRKRHLRRRIRGTPDRPRLSVFRSQKHIHAQIIDDTRGITLVSGSSLDKEIRKELSKTNTREASKIVGLRLSQRAKEKGIRKIVFDRSGYRYHGRVKSLAEGLREGGLDF